MTPADGRLLDRGEGGDRSTIFPALRRQHTVTLVPSSSLRIDQRGARVDASQNLCNAACAPASHLAPAAVSFMRVTRQRRLPHNLASMTNRSHLQATHDDLRASRSSWRGLLFALSALAFLQTPWRSNFRIRTHPICELRAPLELWLAGASNLQHLLSYGLLALLAAPAFRRRPLLTAASFVLALSAVVELEQALFSVGHCRLRDMLPNLLAVGLATAVSGGIRHLRRNIARHPS
jgi:hypothetical protein